MLYRSSFEREQGSYVYWPMLGNLHLMVSRGDVHAALTLVSVILLISGTLLVPSTKEPSRLLRTRLASLRQLCSQGSQRVGL